MERIGHVLATTPIEEVERAVASKSGGKLSSNAKSAAKGKAAPKGKAVARSGSKDKQGSKDKPEEATAAAGKAKAKAKGKSKCGKKGAVTAIAGSNLTMKVERVFEIMDVDHSGFLDVDEFVSGMAELRDVMKVVLSNGEKITNDMLRHLARKLDKTGQISVIEFLEAFCFDDTDDVADALAEHMVAVLFRHRHAIRSGCRYFDQAGKGKVTQEEFMHVLEAVNSEMESTGMHFSMTQMFDLCQAISLVREDGTPEVSYEDFFSSFAVVDSENTAATVRLRRASKSNWT
jgi:Ca2+-binding EF-hand superfamily protein